MEADEINRKASYMIKVLSEMPRDSYTWPELVGILHRIIPLKDYRGFGTGCKDARKILDIVIENYFEKVDNCYYVRKTPQLKTCVPAF
jgi:hypothetical protein